jgi:hypothetical protein
MPDRCTILLDGNDGVPRRGQRNGEQPGPRVQVQDPLGLELWDVSLGIWALGFGISDSVQHEPHEDLRRGDVGLEERRRRDQERRPGDRLAHALGAGDLACFPAEDEPVVSWMDVDVQRRQALRARERRLRGDAHALARFAVEHQRRSDFVGAERRTHDDALERRVVETAEGVLELERQLVGARVVHRALDHFQQAPRAPGVMPHDAALEDEVRLLPLAPRVVG